MSSVTAGLGAHVHGVEHGRAARRGYGCRVTAKQRGPGRPPLAEGAAKARMFALRLTSEEHLAIEAAAARAGKPVTQWAREALLAALGLR